jgi:hypothetical protein
MSNVKCPKCGYSFEPSEAYKKEFEESVSRDSEEKHKKELEAATLLARKSAEDKYKEENVKELAKANKEKELLAEKLLKEQANREVFEKKIIEEASKKADEEQRLKIKEKDITIDQIKKINEDLQRKLEQGSQQKQGEALELDLEGKLKSTFIYDEFLPVPKGVRGGDIIQNVRNKFGKVASTIIWEFKRTKTWDKNWLTKLREDARTITANESIIVSDILPEGIQFYGKIDGVWVTNVQYAIPLANILREMGIRIAVAKSGIQHDDESLRKIHEYILSEKFRHKIEKDVETTTRVLSDLEKKHNVDEKYYRIQKSSLEALQANTTQIYFDLQEIVPALPSIAGLEGELLDEDEQESLI